MNHRIFAYKKSLAMQGVLYVIRISKRTSIQFILYYTGFISEKSKYLIILDNTNKYQNNLDIILAILSILLYNLNEVINI